MVSSTPVSSHQGIFESNDQKVRNDNERALQADPIIQAALAGRFPPAYQAFAAQLPAAWSPQTRNIVVTQKIAYDKGYNTSGLNSANNFQNTDNGVPIAVQAAPYVIGALGGIGAASSAFGGAGAGAGSSAYVAADVAHTAAASLAGAGGAGAGGGALGLSGSTWLGIGQLVVGTASNLYSQNKQLDANATAAQIQAQTAKDALDYTKLQGQQTQTNFETTQHANYDQWVAAQRYANDTSAARTRNINSLGAQYGVAARDIPTYAIPAYVPSTNVLGGAPGTVGSGGATATSTGATMAAGVPSTGTAAAAGPVAGGDYRAWFNNLVAGKPFNQQTLLDLAKPGGAFDAAGVKLTPPNANGEQTKIGLPDGSWVRVGFGEGQPVWVPQGGGAAAPAPAYTAPVTAGGDPFGTVNAAGLGATATAAAPAIAPALTVTPYQRRTVRDYFAAA